MSARKAQLLGIAAVGLGTLIPQIYLASNPQISLDWSWFVLAVALPLVLAAAIFAALRSWTILFSFLALLWAVTDDAPVNLDSIYTWPEVTRVHPVAPHLIMEVVLHVLTVAFLVLAVRSASRGRRTAGRRTIVVWTLAFFAFVASYVQNIPLALVQQVVASSWYELDIVEHALAVALIYLAVREAGR